MNFNCIIKTGLVAVAAMVSLSSFSQDLIARQAPIDKKLKTVDSLALQKQIRAEPVSYTHLDVYKRQVGIIAMFAYNYLVMLVDRVVNKMESRTMEFMDLLNEPAQK